MRFVSNSPVLTDKDASIIGKFITKRFGGNVTAKKLLEAARDPKSPVHDYFEWDDSLAAERYREKQARELIVSISIESDGQKPLRHFLSVTIDNKKTYLASEDVAKSQDLIDQVIENAKQQLESWKDRYDRYCDYFQLQFTAKGKTHVISKAKGKEIERRTQN